jgi:hypothetical protein
VKLLVMEGGIEPGRKPEEPVDRCPYAGRDLEDCIAYEGVSFQPQTSTFDTLRPSVTCRHLQVGQAIKGRFYPRCELGDAESRRLRVLSGTRQVGGAWGPTYKIEAGYVAELLDLSSKLNRETYVLLQRSEILLQHCADTRRRLHLTVVA